MADLSCRCRWTSKGRVSAPIRPARGFTLVELLVVIGIIAVLLGILLPALNKARRQAQDAQCQSNMRQLALGVLQYCNDNHGHVMLGWIDAPAAGSKVPYPDGWGWAGELMFQGYVRGPNYYVNPNDTSATPATHVVASSPFRCPLDADTLGSPDNGLYPTDIANNGYYISMASKNFPRADGSPLHAVVASYSLNVNNDVTASKATTQTPFVYFKQSSLSSLPYFTRSLSQIRHSAVTIMLLEDGGSSDPWTATGGAATVNGVAYNVTRVAARHGLKYNTAVDANGTIKGSDAATNMAFFDGHVGQYLTYPLFSKANPLGSPWLWVGDPTMGVSPTVQGGQ